MMTQVSTGHPTITTHPTNQLISVGMNVTLNCVGTGRKSIKYRWETISNDKVISNTSGKALTLRNIQDSGQYRCVASNKAGETRSKVATITVLSKLLILFYIIFIKSILTEITNHPADHAVVALTEVVLSCSSSVDDAAYTWHCVGGSVPARSTGKSSQTLTIPRATPHDEGMYYCMASKDRVSVESNRAAVMVDGENKVLSL